MEFLPKLLAGAIRVTILIAYAALAGMVAERVGVVNMVFVIDCASPANQSGTTAEHTYSV